MTALRSSDRSVRADPARPSLRGGTVLRPRNIVLALVAVWLLLAIFAPTVLTAYSPVDGVLTEKLRPPSAQHWFGTDNLGRDVYARVVHGAALTLRTAVLAVLIAGVIGTVGGIAAGFVGGWFDSVFVRIIDVLLAIPSLLLSLAIIAAIGRGSWAVTLAVGLAGIATFARVSRAEVVRIRNMPYVEASTVLGSSEFGAFRKHVLPNSLGPALALATLEFGTAILAIAGLSFLGYGELPPTPEWGRIVAEGRDFLATAWWISLLPSLVIAITVLWCNSLARGIRRSR